MTQIENTVASTLARSVAAERLYRRIEIRAPERIALAFFVYLAILGWVQGVPLVPQLVLLVLPIGLCVLWRLEEVKSSPPSKVVREWASLGLILAGYWCLEWFSIAPLENWQNTLARWDRTLLDVFRMRHAIEIAGSIVPSVLETVYLLLYVIPILSLGAVYGLGGRLRANRYLLVLFLGTFSAYALLPLFPVVSPRIAFSGSDLPHFSGTARSINTWLLDHMDISTSVFPSGHVAVAFSSAFGLLAVLPERRAVWIGAFAAATAVFVATVYGRYHYAADGLASIVITFLAWNISRRWREHAS